MYLQERIKYAVRFRHKRGFGVHSPFVFDLITQAIRDRKGRYIYPKLAEEEGRISKRERQFYRLMFRLVSYLSIDSVYLFTSQSEMMEQYLTGLQHDVAVKSNTEEGVECADLICVGMQMEQLADGEFLLQFLSNQEKRKCVVVTNIHKNGSNKFLWKVLEKEATVAMDMMWHGILFFDRKLQRGRYKI